MYFVYEMRRVLQICELKKSPTSLTISKNSGAFILCASPGHYIMEIIHRLDTFLCMLDPAAGQPVAYRYQFEMGHRDPHIDLVQPFGLVSPAHRLLVKMKFIHRVVEKDPPWLRRHGHSLIKVASAG